MRWLRRRWPNEIRQVPPSLADAIMLCAAPGGVTSLEINLGATDVGGEYKHNFSRLSDDSKEDCLHLSFLASLPNLRSLKVCASEQEGCDSAECTPEIGALLATAVSRIRSLQTLDCHLWMWNFGCKDEQRKALLHMMASLPNLEEVRVLQPQDVAIVDRSQHELGWMERSNLRSITFCLDLEGDAELTRLELLTIAAFVKRLPRLEELKIANANLMPDGSYFDFASSIGSHPSLRRICLSSDESEMRDKTTADMEYHEHAFPAPQSRLA
jgi:hypothetical protein